MENQRSHFDISNVSDEIITEKELPSYLLSLESQAHQHIQNNDLISALSALKRSEEIMESISLQGGSLSSELVISIPHNISYCYQKYSLNRLDDPKKLLTYIDACYYNAKTLNFIRGRVSYTEDKIRRSKYLAKLSLQYSSLLASQNKPKKSLKLANSAYEYSCKAINDTHEGCKKHYQNLQFKMKKNKLTKSEQNRLLLIQRAIPTLEVIQAYLRKGNLHKVDMRSALGIKGYPEWISQFNTTEFLTITPVKSAEFTSGLGIQAEFTKDYLFYKIALLATSLHFLGTRNESVGNSYKSQKYSLSARRFIGNFVNQECPIFRELNENASKISLNAGESPGRKSRKKIKRNKSMSYHITKFNVQSSSFSKFSSVLE